MSDKQNDLIANNDSVNQTNINQSSTIDPSFFRKTNKYKNIREPNWLLRMFILIPGYVVAIFLKFFLMQRSNPSSTLAATFIHLLINFLAVLIFIVIMNLFRKQKVKNIVYHSAVYSLLLVATEIFARCSVILKPIQ